MAYPAHSGPRVPSGLPADWSSLELRTLAGLGVDVHALTARSLGVSRQEGKRASFAALYGSSVLGLVTPDVGARRTGLKVREWLRWLVGWTRGGGHRWALLGTEGAGCSRCGFYLPAPSRGRVLKPLPQKPERRRRERPSMSCDLRPSELRRRTLSFLRNLGPCDLVTVSRVMDS